MNVVCAYTPVLHFDDDNGNPLAGGKLCTYHAGTNTPIVTYADRNGTENPVKIPLNSRGECVVWLVPLVRYKFVIVDRFGNEKPWADDFFVNASGESGQGVTKEYVDAQDGLLDAKIEAETAARAEADANLKDYVDSNVLRIAPPEYAGDGEVIFYRGQLLQ